MGWHSWRGGKRYYRKKDAPVLDSDDEDSLSSPTLALKEKKEVEVSKDQLLDQWVDDLYVKRASTRENALWEIIKAFNSSLQHEFVEKKFATMLYPLLSSIKKGSGIEVVWASHLIGLIALTTGPGEKAREIFEQSFTPMSEALKKRPGSSGLLACLAVITFVGGEDAEETEKSMQLMWQMAHQKLDSNVAAAKPSSLVHTTAIGSWSFLLTIMNGSSLNSKTWQESVSYFSTLLDKDDRSLRIAAGEALALIFESGSLEKFCSETEESNGDDGGNISRKLKHINGLKSKVLNQVSDLSSEGGGKGTCKKGLNNQRNTFQDILYFLEDGYIRETSVKIGAQTLKTSTWAELIQLNFLRRFLGQGFLKHMQGNQFLHDVFGFTPKKKPLPGVDRLSDTQKRMFKSPNSALNKARTQSLNKQRTLSQDKNAGRYAVGFADDD